MPYVDRIERRYGHPLTCTCVPCVARRYGRVNLFFRWHFFRWFVCAALLVGLLGIPVWSRAADFEDVSDAPAWKEAFLAYPEDMGSWWRGE